jgi:hypothetical protein
MLLLSFKDLFAKNYGGRKSCLLFCSFHECPVDWLPFIIYQGLHVAESSGFIMLLIIQSIQDNGGKIVDLYKCISSTV